MVISMALDSCEFFYHCSKNMTHIYFIKFFVLQLSIHVDAYFLQFSPLIKVSNWLLLASLYILNYFLFMLSPWTVRFFIGKLLKVPPLVLKYILVCVAKWSVKILQLFLLSTLFVHTWSIRVAELSVILVGLETSCTNPWLEHINQILRVSIRVIFKNVLIKISY